MIAGIGIDAVDIQRFASWKKLTPRQLRRVFSEHEIAAFLSDVHNSAFLAKRFAAREALLKALGSCCTRTMPLLYLCSAVVIMNTPQGMPYALIDWKRMQPYLTLPADRLTCHISITDTSTVAYAVAILEYV